MIGAIAVKGPATTMGSLAGLSPAALVGAVAVNGPETDPFDAQQLGTVAECLTVTWGLSDCVTEALCLANVSRLLLFLKLWICPDYHIVNLHFLLCLRPCRQELSASACLLAVATVVEHTVFVMAAVDMTAQLNEALAAAVRVTVTAAEAVTSRLTVMVSWAV